MNHSKFRQAIPLMTLIAISVLSGSLASADEKIDNPKYALWSNFKPGSTSTVSTDLDIQGKKIHLDVVKTLVSVSPDDVVVSTVVKVLLMSREQDQPPKSETIPARTSADDFKSTGEKEIEAMGKTFKCKVWDAKGGDPNSKTIGPEAAMTNMTATIYTNQDVPGGLVKLETVGKAGMTMTFILTAMEAK